MSSADDRREDEDVWAEVVAEDAAAQAAARQQAEQREKEARQDAADEDPFGGSGAGEGLGPDLGPLVDEVRRLASAVGERMQEASRALGTGEGLDRLAAPLKERHPEVYRHLAAAGGELLAAYRAAVSGHERRWSTEKPSGSERIDLD